MEYAIRLFFVVLKAILQRYLIPFIIVTVVLTVVVGAICALAGGELWLAVRYTLYFCGGVGILAAFVTAFGAIFNWRP